MRLVLVVLCVVAVSGDEPKDLEAMASEDSQWTPFFSEASRASEGLPWGSVAPKLTPDSQSAASSPENHLRSAINHQETYPKSTTNLLDQSFKRGDSNPSEERKDVHKVTITKKIRVPYTVHVEKRIPKIIEVPVDRPFNVYVPKPYPVIVEKKVPYEIKVAQPQPYTVEKRVPYPVKVLVDKPYTLHVPKPYPVDVEKKYEFTVEKKIPYEVKVPVERPYPVHVIVEKEVKFPVEKKVPVPVKVPYEKPIPIHVTKHVPVDVDKPVPYTVEKVITYPIKVPFRIPIKVHYPDGGLVEEVHGDAQNLEWAEAMNKATRAAKLESRPAQWHGDSLGLSPWQESQTALRWHGDSQKISQDSQKQWQAEAVGPSQYHAESLRPTPYRAESLRPPQRQEHSLRPPQRQEHSLRPNNIRQGFSAGRGIPTRNSYLGKVHKRPTTKLLPVGYEVKEAQFEQPSASPFLNRPGSEVIVPQLVLAQPPPNIASVQNPPTGVQQSLRSSLRQSNSLEQPKYVQSGSQSNSGGSAFLFSNGQLSGPTNNHQTNASGSSFSVTNVFHHAGIPSQQTVVHHSAPSKPPSSHRLQYLNNNLVSESAQLPSSTFFTSAQNVSQLHNTQNAPTDSRQTPFGTSGFTISFHSPPQQQPQQQPQTPEQLSQQFLPTPLSPKSNDHVSSSYVGSTTVREGQELSYSSAIHHPQNTPTLT